MSRLRVSQRTDIPTNRS